MYNYLIALKSRVSQGKLVSFNCSRFVTSAYSASLTFNFPLSFANILVHREGNKRERKKKERTEEESLS